ncbi:hypothetical protein Tco_0779446 [Tanacetum coccineum]
MASSPKIDSLLDEFAGELITIPPGIVNREHEEYISLMERLLYNNSSPRPPEDFHANPNTIIESRPTYPIPLRIVTLSYGKRSINSPEPRFTIRGYALKSNHEIFLLHFPRIDTLHPFSSENEDKVFNHGVLTSEEKSPSSSSQRGFKSFKLYHIKARMLIHGEEQSIWMFRFSIITP